MQLCSLIPKGERSLYAKRASWWLSDKESACNAGDPGSIPESGRSPGEGNGNPLQYSFLENSMERGAWWATVHEVTKMDMARLGFTDTPTVGIRKKFNLTETSLFYENQSKVLKKSKQWPQISTVSFLPFLFPCNCFPWSLELAEFSQKGGRIPRVRQLYTRVVHFAVLPV